MAMEYYFQGLWRIQGCMLNNSKAMEAIIILNTNGP
jgi:hypothetical protein